jgi:hypothetical protein
MSTKPAQVAVSLWAGPRRRFSPPPSNSACTGPGSGSNSHPRRRYSRDLLCGALLHVQAGTPWGHRGPLGSGERHAAVRLNYGADRSRCPAVTRRHFTVCATSLIAVNAPHLGRYRRRTPCPVRACASRGRDGSIRSRDAPLLSFSAANQSCHAASWELPLLGSHGLADESLRQTASAVSLSAGDDKQVDPVSPSRPPHVGTPRYDQAQGGSRRPRMAQERGVTLPVT